MVLNIVVGLGNVRQMGYSGNIIQVCFLGGGIQEEGFPQRIV